MVIFAAPPRQARAPHPAATSTGEQSGYFYNSGALQTLPIFKRETLSQIVPQASQVLMALTEPGPLHEFSPQSLDHLFSMESDGLFLPLPYLLFIVRKKFRQDLSRLEGREAGAAGRSSREFSI